MSESESVMFLKGRNISLRPLQREDMKSCVQWINDPKIRDLVSSYLPMTINDENEWFDSLSKRKSSDIVLAMVTNDGTYIGNMAIHDINWRDRVGTTGAIIGEKSYWGKGLGTEAKTLLLHHAFYTMNLHKICSQVIAYNVRSRKYSEKCGYKYEGTFRKQVFRKGKYWDLVNLAVFEKDFRPVWKRYTEGN